MAKFCEQIMVPDRGNMRILLQYLSCFYSLHVIYMANKNFTEGHHCMSEVYSMDSSTQAGSSKISWHLSETSPLPYVPTGTGHRVWGTSESWQQVTAWLQLPGLSGPMIPGLEQENKEVTYPSVCWAQDSALRVHLFLQVENEGFEILCLGRKVLPWGPVVSGSGSLENSCFPVTMTSSMSWTCPTFSPAHSRYANSWKYSCYVFPRENEFKNLPHVLQCKMIYHSDTVEVFVSCILISFKGDYVLPSLKLAVEGDQLNWIILKWLDARSHPIRLASERCLI